MGHGAPIPGQNIQKKIAMEMAYSTIYVKTILVVLELYPCHKIAKRPGHLVALIRAVVCNMKLKTISFFQFKIILCVYTPHFNLIFC